MFLATMFPLLILVLTISLTLIIALVAFTQIATRRIERTNPPVGQFAEIDGARLHYVHVPNVDAPGPASAPSVVFIHGASANLKDQMLPLRPLLKSRHELLFFDRPGHGWSERGAGNNTPEAQAVTLAKLMDHCGIDRAVIVGHSFGGSITSAFALAYPERTAGLVFVAAATHPWEGGRTSWYYHLTAVPLIGGLFAHTLALPAGLLRMGDAVDSVFAPNITPKDYARRSSISLVLRPSAFRANATDVQSLYPYALRAAPRYAEIKAPTVVISGNRDTVVYEEIHSIGLKRDIAGAELVWVHNLGHKPDWIAPELVAASVEQVSGQIRDLQALARQVEARIADDRQGAGKHYDAEAPAADQTGQLAPL